MKKYLKRLLRPAWRLWWLGSRGVSFTLLRGWAKLMGADVAHTVRFSGWPLLRIHEGGRMVLRDGVVIHSAIAANPVIGRRTTTLAVLAPGALLELDRNVGCSSVCICAAKEIRIGEGTIIGADAMILDNDFHLPLPDWRWGNAAAETARPIWIGRGCFIGTRAIILKGVTIGDGAVVGAGAVVTRDVPAGHLAFGNPARVTELDPKWRRGIEII